MLRGWFQSKQSKVLKEPRVAARVRLSRLLASRARRSMSTSFSHTSVGEERALVEVSSRARRESGEARKPRVRSLSMMSTGGVVITLQGVRGDVPVGDVAAEGDFQGEGLAQGAATLLAEGSQGARVVRAAGEDVSHGLGQQGLAIGIQQAQGASGEAADVAAGLHLLMVTKKRGFLVMGRRELPDFKTTP
jgi:hypothetical protein